MNTAQLLAHFRRISDAADAIPHLRQFVLQLAVRGQLVPQDPNEEPAANLLHDRELFPNPGMEPLKLPPGWAWSSYRLIGETIGGGTPSKANPEYWDGLIPWVSPKDMKVDFIGDAQDHVSDLGIECSSTRLVPPGSLLMVVRGMILVHSFPTAIAVVPVTINQDMKAIVPFRPELSSILLLISKGMRQEVLRLVLRSTHGTCKLLTDDLFSLPLPIPPLAEQHRIVAKVDELMALCDRLEAAQAERESRRDHLVSASLHRLNAPADAEDKNAFRERARFHLRHLPRLTTRAEHIQQLRQTILKVAVRGQLVRQDPTDEPAAELLARIHAEKSRLIESGNISDNGRLHIKAKAAPPDYCPTGWTWVRFRDVIWCFRGHNPPKSNFVTSSRPGYVRFVQITDFKTDAMAVYVPITNKLKMVHRGEIIMAAYRHIGKVSRKVEGAFNVALCKVNEIAPMNRDFVEFLIGTDLVRGELLRASERGHIPSMHSDHLLSLWVAIPPLPEQDRILKRYGELMRLCDRIEAQLTTAQTENQRLLEAVLHEALAVA